jgi:hypothetical protein
MTHRLAIGGVAEVLQSLKVQRSVGAVFISMNIRDAFVPMNKSPGRMAVLAGLKLCSAHFSSQMREKYHGNSR